MISLEEFNQRQRVVEELISKIPNKNIAHYSNLSSANIVFSLNSFLHENSLERTKTYLFVVAELGRFRIEKFNDRYFDFDLSSTCYVLLCDNWSYLENTYSKLRYSSYYIDDKTHQQLPITMDENVLNGESAIWCNTIQFFMANDISGVERNLNIIEDITLPKLPKNQQELNLDFEYYKALLKKDKSECEAILNELLTPKTHKKRNDNPVLAQYVSQPALGYAKLAWCLGVEVEVNNSLVPKELLPIQPLDYYEIPYDFLK